MLRLSSLEWDNILLDNFSAKELCDVMLITKSIRDLILKDSKLMKVVRMRKIKFSFTPISRDRWKNISLFEGINRKCHRYKECGKRRLNCIEKLANWPKSVETDFAIFESQSHIIVMNGSFVFNLDFFL